MKEIQVLGVHLQDYTVREAMRKIDEFWRNGRLNSIGFVTTKGLIQADEMPEVKEWMQSLDLTVPADVDILNAAGIDSQARSREIEENLFIKEFLRRTARYRKSVFVLAENEQQMGVLVQELLEYQEHLKIVGTFVWEELTADEDFLVNEINIAAPDILISQLATPHREEFFAHSRMKLHTFIWLILKEGVSLSSRRKSLRTRFYEYLTKKIFRIKVEKERKETEES